MSSVSKGGRCLMALGAGESCIKGFFFEFRSLLRDMKVTSIIFETVPTVAFLAEKV